jgi:hypothetical protein
MRDAIELYRGLERLPEESRTVMRGIARSPSDAMEYGGGEGVQLQGYTSMTTDAATALRFARAGWERGRSG